MGLSERPPHPPSSIALSIFDRYRYSDDFSLLPLHFTQL